MKIGGIGFWVKESPAKEQGLDDHQIDLSRMNANITLAVSEMQVSASAGVIMLAVPFTNEPVEDGSYAEYEPYS